MYLSIIDLSISVDTDRYLTQLIPTYDLFSPFSVVVILEHSETTDSENMSCFHEYLTLFHVCFYSKTSYIIYIIDS
jgi:hypothetical protein